MKKNYKTKAYLSAVFATVFGTLLSMLFLTACKGIPLGGIHSSNKHNETILVDNHKIECTLYNAANKTLCIQFKIKGDSDWIIEDADLIENFSYQWGYNYELEVEVEDLDPVPQDASNKNYTFIKQVSKIKAVTGGKFELSISGNSTTTQASIIQRVLDKTNTFKIYDDKEIECSSADCSQIDTLIAENKAILFEFKHPDSPEKPLVFNEIKCSATQDNFTKFEKEGGCFKPVN